jgi:non-specific serine/threonine protein kinase
MTALIGREHERAALHLLLLHESARLVTLTGPGGIGKTRLALAIAADLAGSFRDGVRFVDLSSIADADHFGTAVAAALDISDNSQAPILEAITAALRGRELLLVLDNFEHVARAAIHLAPLLEACPRLALLVTSRALLHATGEQEFAIGALELPRLGASLEDVSQVAAVTLFVQRAQVARADFALTAANAQAVAEICVRLDGIPLALELAAARIKILSAEQIARRLEDRFNLLTGGALDGPERHRTLRAALDWSFLMLHAPGQALLRRLAVFAGGAALEAVESVCADASLPVSKVLDGLEQLVDHSLLVVREEAGEARYRLLETVRQYALERLLEASEESAVRERHLDWYVGLSERAEPELFGTLQAGWLVRLEREHDNVRAALAWSIAHDEASRALRLAAGLWKFWEVRGHGSEGLRWLEAGLALPGGALVEDVVRVRAQHGAASLAWLRGDYDRSTALHEANLTLRRQMGDQHGLAVSLLHLADIMRSRGAADDADQRCNQSLALFRAEGDPRWCGVALNSLAMALLDQRDLAAARSAIEEGLALFRQVGGARRIALALGNLGDVARAEGAYEEAHAVLAESLESFVELEDAWGSSLSLQSLALVATARGEPIRAARLFGAAEGQREVAAVPLPPADRPEHDRAVATLRLRLGREALAQAWAYGRSLSLVGTVDLACAPSDEREPAPIATLHPRMVDSPLTEREREVANLVARGLTNRQIADALVISKQTADKHLGNILGKLGLASRAQVAVWVVQNGVGASAA